MFTNIIKAVWMFYIIPLLLMVLQTLLGALFGWGVGLIFGKTILNILEQIGIYGVSMWQVGAFLGFVSAYFKTLITFNDKRKSKKEN